MRQEPLRLNLPNSVSVVGCGGVGSWTALFLALAGVPRLILWDADEVSDHNLNRLPVDPDQIGENKALALKRLIATKVPSCDVIAVFRWTPDAAKELGIGAALNDGENWVVAGTDTWSSRQEVFKYARENGLKYVECSAEGEFGGCTGEPAMFATVDEVHPGYASVPVWVGSAVGAAVMACYHVLHGVEPEGDNFRLGWENEQLVAQFSYENIRGAEARTA